MSLQVIRVMETNEDAQTDLVYVDFVCKTFYSQLNVNYLDIFLDGKTHYNDKDIKSQINNYKKMYKAYTGGETVVIYFIDSDKESIEFKEGSFGSNVIKYCIENKYELVFFVKTVENVFWKKVVDDSEKKKYSTHFYLTGQYKKIHLPDLCKENPHNGESNMMVVLDKVLTRKI